MEIIRNGQEFELTSEEMRQVYYEMQDKYAIDDVRSRYNVPDDKIEDVLLLFESTIGGNDSFWDSYWSTIEYVAEKLRLEEREEE